MKKIVAAVLAMIMLCGAALTLASCGQTKTLVMGTNASFPPYEFTDAEGKIVGIDAEIAEAIAEKLGMKLEIKDMEFTSLLTAVQGGSVDMVLAGLTVNDERKQQVDFSDTYSTGIQAIIVPEGSEITSVDDLYADGASFTVGVQSGTTGDIYCTDDFGADNVKQFENGSLAVAALKNGQVDCVVIDNEPAKAYVKANTGLKVLDTEYAVEDYAIALNKNNTELNGKINNALKELIADGTVKKIVDKYITAE